MNDEQEISQSLVDVVAERIEGWILDGTMPLGSKITEQTIATQLGVSRGPLREAIRTLEGRKLIVRTPNRGSRVVAISAGTLDDLLVMREALEGMVCKLATERASANDLDALDELTQSLDEERTMHAFADDLAFHRKLLAIANNSSIANVLDSELYYILKVYRLKSKIVPGRAVEARQEHRDIVKAMRERDPHLAEMLMRRHIRNWRRNIVQLIDTEPVLELTRDNGANWSIR
jgi:DNA-binding GntR family transcriptional regulator